MDYMTKCDTMLERQPGKTDHFPIVTILDITQERTLPKPSQNYREMNWKEFTSTVGKELETIPILTENQTEEEMGREIK